MNGPALLNTNSGERVLVDAGHEFRVQIKRGQGSRVEIFASLSSIDPATGNRTLLACSIAPGYYGRPHVRIERATQDGRQFVWFGEVAYNLTLAAIDELEVFLTLLEIELEGRGL